MREPVRAARLPGDRRLLITLTEYTFTSDLAAGVEAVWDRIASFEGINHELGPLLSMTAPRGAASLTVEDVPIGRPWFRSWVLFARVLPIDYDHLCVERLDPPHGFFERSTMLSAKVWEHERTLVPVGDGATQLTDRVAFDARPGMGPVLRLIVPRIFAHRHRRLRAWFSR